ncbi:GNAT family N-acetyltransferase [Paenibacillus soyae]|uniref:GNAT family N-acetyltransferase n=1 Tax=Paenibacillus soyae TaxID=2969249 RepID=A0A9X2MR46_9BACL|nr:GNAT family N-acetyltransferase [Paenibacillus soyae]MCR2805346.1 GNAT family N-acetyltransferase [Paenibacillus soyae]
MLWGETERLKLYIPDVGRDLEAHSAMLEDPEVGKWLPKGTSYTREETEKLIRYFAAHWERYGYGAWAVYHKLTGRFLGHCGLNRMDEWEKTEVLYAFTREAWGNGYCTEASTAALSHGFGELGLPTLIALAKRDNAPSIAVMKRLEMKYWDSIRWRNMDVVRYEIVNEQK